MRVLVTGYNGQLGFDVVQEGKKQGFKMYGTTREDLDITIKEDVYKYITNIKPDVIIHCAAYTAVDNAEDNKENCFDINVNGTSYLASAAKKINAKFVYISTDYVFDGKGEIPFEVSDEVNPINYYGQTKFDGERIVQEMIDAHYIVRISWVFGLNGNNFVKTMLKLAETREELNVVGDQFGSPTYTLDLSKLLIEMIKTDKYGVYHASNEGFCNWAEFATEIFKQAKKNVKVNSILTKDYPTSAKRPSNSRLSKRELNLNGFTLLPTWQDAINRYLIELHDEVEN